MVSSPKGLGPKKDCAGQGQQHIRKTDPSSRQRGRPTKQDRNCQRVIIYNIWPWAPDGTRHQDLLTDWPSVAMWLWLWLDSRYYTLWDIPCGGGVEYLHRSPARRRRRRKGKSRNWDSKIWSRAPRDSNPKIIALARASSNCKRQTRPLLRESAPHEQTHKCQTVTKIWS
jgi:hypothetical protein